MKCDLCMDTKVIVSHDGLKQICPNCKNGGMKNEETE